MADIKPKLRRTTIADVARMAGVGNVTVSYVLNGRSRAARISPETERRVLEAAQELNYRPNGPARMLVRQRADAVAVVFQYGEYFSAQSSFTLEVMRGVCSACLAAGVDLMLHTKPAADPASEAAALMDGRVDGVLMLRDRQDPTVAEVASRGFPCVAFFTRPDDPTLPFVDSDNIQGGRLAASHLLGLGHRRLGMVAGPVGSVASSHREHGWTDCLREQGIPVSQHHLVRLPVPSSDKSDFLRLMQSPDRPTALFFWSDDIAIACLPVLRELGLRVPQDVSLVGYDSTAAAASSSPPLTSVRQPVVDIAREAASLLISLARQEPVETIHVVFPPELDVRASTAGLSPSTPTNRSLL
jgi:LacI family transcriptional regulator